jgi:4-aminobutyrate aminotransferase / (S)-3-amino-2-methylpropionate transaminase / 5-aminovalerate transaminase
VSNIDVMQEERLPEEAARKGAHAMARLGAMAERHPLIGDVRGLGLMIGVELVRDRATKEPANTEASAIRRHAREAGVLIGVGGQAGNVLRIQPPLMIEDAALDRALDVVDEALGVVGQ